jgi:hypothetical protein
MKVNGQSYAQVALPPESNEFESGLTSGPVWTVWEREKWLSPSGY